MSDNHLSVDEANQLMRDLERWRQGDRDALKPWRDRLPKPNFEDVGYYFDLNGKGKWEPWTFRDDVDTATFEEFFGYYVHQDGEPTRYPFSFENMPTAEELADRLHLPLETAQRILVKLSAQLGEPTSFNDKAKLNALEQLIVLIDLARFICYCEGETDHAIARMPIESLFLKAEIWSRREPEPRIKRQNGVHFSSS